VPADRWSPPAPRILRGASHGCSASLGGFCKYAIVNIDLVAVWFLVAVNLYRESRKLTRELAAAA